MPVVTSAELTHTINRRVIGAYQALEDALACCRTAGLDLPYVVLGDLV
jgi:hypothetical protein